VTIWLTHMMMQENKIIPDQFTVQSPDKGELGYTYMGISMWGYIYASDHSPHMARLIPIEDVREKEKRVTISGFKERPRQLNIAPVVDTQQIRIAHRIYFYVCYEIDPDITWQQIIQTEDIKFRLESAVKVLNALPGWWQLSHAGTIPMPLDIAFVKDSPFLLALPFQGWPRMESFFSEPERIDYMAPEVICSKKSLIGVQNADLYSISVGILKCLGTVKKKQHPDILLQRTANGTHFTKARMVSNLPFWMEKVERINKMRDRLFATVEPDPKTRSIIDPLQMAKALSDDIEYLNPEKAVSQLLKEGRSEQAFALIEEILIDHNTYEILLMGANIAANDLDRTIEAISLFDQAIEKKPDNHEAYKAQLQLILEKTLEVFVLYHADEANKNENILSKLDKMVSRDFTSIPVSDQKQVLIDVGRYFITRKQFTKATKIIYNYLFDGKTLLWWEFSRTLLYAEALIGENRIEEAEKFLLDIKSRLKQVADEKRMSQIEINAHGAQLAQLDVMIFKAKSNNHTEQ